MFGMVTPGEFTMRAAIDAQPIPLAFFGKNVAVHRQSLRQHEEALDFGLRIGFALRHESYDPGLFFPARGSEGLAATPARFFVECCKSSSPLLLKRLRSMAQRRLDVKVDACTGRSGKDDIGELGGCIHVLRRNQYRHQENQVASPHRSPLMRSASLSLIRQDRAMLVKVGFFSG